MRWAVLLLVVLASCSICLPVAGIPLPPAINITEGVPPAPPGLTIMASPSGTRIGDIITLNGTVTGIHTIAVYLFVTGPGLDPRGVALENLKIAAGRGLFTTAPVKMGDGTWTYEWDTSVIVGTLKPGNYSVYVVASPLDRLRSNPQETAVVQVSFAPAQTSSAQSPLPLMVPVAALVIAGILFAAVMRRE